MTDQPTLAEWIEQVDYALDRSVDGPIPEGEMWDLIVPIRDLAEKAEAEIKSLRERIEFLEMIR